MSLYTHTHQSVILENGFAQCLICQYYLVYECPDCYCLLRYKGANHNCSNAEEAEDEGLGQDIEQDQSTAWDNIDPNKCVFIF